jgi:hypothetical protein
MSSGRAHTLQPLPPEAGYSRITSVIAHVAAGAMLTGTAWNLITRNSDAA